MGNVAGEELGVQPDTPHLPLNALNGGHTYQTMRIIGKINNEPLHILVDSGSTHNFSDISTAKKLHCDIKNMTPLQPNGHQLQRSSMHRDFTCTLLGEEFRTDVVLVPLGSC